MSRSRPQSRKKHMPGGDVRSPRVWRLPVVIAVFLLAGIVTFLWFGDNPRRLLDQARTIRDINPDRADELLERSLVAAGGNFPEAQLERCLLFAARHRWLEAMGCFSQIANPRECEALELVRLAKLAVPEGLNYLAEQALAAARRPGPAEPEVLRSLISLNQRLNRSETVVADCTRLAELDPADPMPWLIKARIHDNRRDVAAALEAFQRARDRDLGIEDLNETRNDMAELYLHEGNLAAARDQLEQLQTARPKSTSDRLKWSYLLRVEGDFEGAVKEVDAVLQNSPNDPNGLELRGVLMLDTGRPVEAIADLSRVLKLYPNSVEIHSKLGQAYQKLKQPEKATQHLERSRDLIEIREELANVLSTLKKEPGNAKLLNRAAELRKSLGDFTSALKQ